MMINILRDLIDQGIMICYMDDILIHTPSVEGHCLITHKVLATLRSHKLLLKLEKCKFKWEKVKYLGLIIS